LTDWKEKTLAYWETINRMAARRYGEGVLAEEAALAVIEGLQADDWHRVRAFNEQASFTTFVRSLIARLLEDFARKRFGRVRPPLWVKTFGGIWEKLFTALCLERLPVSEAVEVVLQRQTVAGKSEIEDAAYQLLGRIPDCGHHQGLEVAYDEQECAEGNCAGGNHAESVADRAFEEQQKAELLMAIFQLILGEEEFVVSDPLLQKLNRLQIRLSAEERLLLKLFYQDGLDVAKAGEMLGMSRFQVHGKKRRLMARLKNELERTGLADDLRLLLDV
jgi:RNA polymerase sigma factor (sigma-70 family)